MVTWYTNVQLLNTEIVGHINDKRSNSVRQFPEDVAICSRFPAFPGVLDSQILHPLILS